MSGEGGAGAAGAPPVQGESVLLPGASTSTCVTSLSVVSATLCVDTSKGVGCLGIF